MKEREILTRGPGRGMPRRARVRDLVSGALDWLARSAALAALLLTMPSAAQAQGTEQSETITTTSNGRTSGLTVEGEHFTISNGDVADKDGMTAYDSEGGITVKANDTEWITKVVITCGSCADYVTDESITVSPGTKTIGDGGTITVENVNASTFNLKCNVYTNAPQFKQFVVYYLPAAPPTFSVSLKDGTKDADKWTAKAGTGEAKALPLEGVAAGEKVTLQYEGRKRVMSVRATKKVVWDGDLSKLTGSEPEDFATATNGMTITGTLAANVKVTIAAGAKVTLRGATIEGMHVSDAAYEHAGITCLGSATIVLVGKNTVKGFNEYYPGIYVPEEKTLTICGDGSLDAQSNGWGCGIGGGGLNIHCGNITIEGGSITATGGSNAAGIGGGGGNSCGDIRITGGTVNAMGGDSAAGIGGGASGSSGDILITGGTVEAKGGMNAAGIGSGFGDLAICGNILITGGTVEAEGGDKAAGIGSGLEATCLDITITSGVTKVTATKGKNAQYSIGEGEGQDTKCGTVTIGCTLDTDGNPVGGKVGMVRTSPYIYPEPIDLSKLTADYEAQDGATLTGTLQKNVKISIADKATVTLSGATINGANDGNCEWAGLTCLGDATIVLVGTNTVKGFYENYPGIYVPEDNTLTISGEGSLDAKSNGWGCGIGGGLSIVCGNITIEGGIITATGGQNSAGIGSGSGAEGGDIRITGGTVVATGGDNAAGIGSGFGDIALCGDIRITGGTVEAYGGDGAAGIGGGFNASCDDITITSGVTKVTATKGEDAKYSIGKGFGSKASCGTVTIGCTLDTDGKPVAGTGKVGMVSTSPYIYPEPIDLSTLTEDYEAQDGATLTGTLQGNVKISIADKATVTLKDAKINADGEWTSDYYAGLNCLGDATIVLVGTNTVNGFEEDYPGIYVPEGSTLTICGDGSLDASRYSCGCGIGGGQGIPCGNITIEGGSITATGGIYAAGIGSGEGTSCGDILIKGGTVEAKGGYHAAGIGSGWGSNCGKITITSGVTKVTATAGDGATFSIGKGDGSNAKCGTVTIGCTLDTSGNPVGGDTYTYGIDESPFVYEPSN